MTIRIKRSVATFAAITLAAVGMSACGKSDTSKAKTDDPNQRIKIAIVVPEIANPYWAAAIAGAKAAAEKHNVDLAISGTTGYTPSQYNSLIQNSVAAGAKGLLIAPGDPVAGNTVIKKATDAGIKVATVIVDAPESTRSFFMGPDAPALGEGQAKRALDLLNKQGATGTVEAAITSCSPTALSQVQQRKTFTDTIQDANPYSDKFKVKVVTFINAGADPTTNLAAYDNLATAYPKLKVVASMCGIDTISAGSIAKKRNTGWIVAGDSWVPQILDMVESGHITFSVNEMPYETLEEAVAVMAAGIRGTKEFPDGPQEFKQVVTTALPASDDLPADGVVDVATARKSPDAVG